METTTIKTKKCTRCGKELPVAMFHKHRDGLQPYCKTCQTEYMREAYAKKKAAKKAEADAKIAQLFRDTPADAPKIRFKTLQDYSPRELMAELSRRGYRGELTFTEVHKIRIDGTIME